jgi:hypothetical protein
VPADTPVFVVATVTKPLDDQDSGFITVLHVTGSPVLNWSGANAPRGQAAPTLAGGFSNRAGTTMLTIDVFQFVTLQVADADHFVVHNAAGVNTPNETGYIWILTAPLPVI